MARTIAIAHPGGGVGKTTTALNLGYELAAGGLRVTVVDLDPGGELSFRLGQDPVAPTLADVLMNGHGTPATVRCAWGEPPTGFAFVSAGQNTMLGMELMLNSVPHAREYRLARALPRPTSS